MSTAATAIRIGPADHGRHMTMQEFLDAEEVPGYLYELARGVLEVSNVPDDWHAEIIDKIHSSWVLFRQANPHLIRWIGHGSEIRLRIPEMSSDRHPDLGIVFRGTKPDAKDRRRPRLVVEVVSKGRRQRDRDYVAKREEYQALGIEEYWIVDFADRAVTVCSLGPDGVFSESRFAEDEPIASPLLPGYAAHPREFWDEVIEAEMEPEGELLP